MIGRLILTVILAGIWSAIVFGFNAEATIVTGQSAGAQFQPNDAAYLNAVTTARAVTWINSALSVVGLFMLALIWWKPAKKGIAALSAMALVLIITPPARAYYDKSDYTENYFILTNESAFFIPDVADNKSGQAAFGSLAYYEQNKIAAKRFNIPHVKLENSGLWSNFYVPAGRLIIVDRTPQSREWVKSAHRGTSKGDQSFPCQSKEGLDVTVGIAIGVSVQEQDAPKFLYRFGVEPPQGDRRQPEVIFQSVFYGRSLQTVTDGPVRNKVQSVVCDEITSKSLDEANAQAPAIMKAIEGKAKQYLGEYGVTLDYIGWADTFEFGDKVQGAIDRTYVANKEADIAKTMTPYTSTMQALATAEATRTIADGLKSGAVKLPTSLSIMDFSWLRDIFSHATGQAKPPQ